MTQTTTVSVHDKKPEESLSSKPSRARLIAVLAFVTVAGTTLAVALLLGRNSIEALADSPSKSNTNIGTNSSDGDEITTSTSTPSTTEPRRPPTLFLLDHPDLQLDYEHTQTSDDYRGRCEQFFVPPLFDILRSNQELPRTKPTLHTSPIGTVPFPSFLSAGWVFLAQTG